MGAVRVPDQPSWLVPFGVVAMVGVGAGIVAAGLPPGREALTLVLLVAAAALWALALTERVTDLRVVVPALVGVGLAGAGLDWLQSRGPGFVAGYMALAGLALRAPRRLALMAGVPVLAAVAATEARGSRTATSAVLSVALGAGFLFLVSAFAAMNRDARGQAVQLLEQQALTQRAREEAVALAERSRLARELHDVLAHSLAGLTVQLEAARLLADTSGSDAQVVEQIARAQALAREGMSDATRAVRALRGEEIPGPAALPRLVADFERSSGVPTALVVGGTAAPLAAEAGLTLYRTVQECLTNVAKHAGRGAAADVRVRWGVSEVEVAVTDRGGDGADSGMPSSGSGLAGMSERAASSGGKLVAGSTGSGFEVRLTLPLAAQEGMTG